MPTGLNPIVQKMIDAGESEDNIATVIQHYKNSVPPADTNVARANMNAQEGPAPAPDWKTNLGAALEPLAHPQTLGDFGSLLIPSGGAEVVGKALAPVGRAISKYGGAAAKLAASAGTALMPSSMVAPARAAVNVLSELKPSEWNSPLTVAGREGRAHAAVASQVDRFMSNTGGMPTSTTVAPTSGRIPYAAPVEAAAADAAPAASAGLTTVEKATLAKKYPGLDPAKVEQQMSGRLQMAPTDRPPMTVAPESSMQLPTGTSQFFDLPGETGSTRLSLQAPRAQVGAEAVGRQQGMTTQAVRDTTGPIRGEATGEAAGMPKAPMERILQKLIDMGPTGQGLEETAREAYAAAGRDPKTRVQVQAALDALRKVGYAIPLTVGGGMMTGRLRPVQEQ